MRKALHSVILPMMIICCLAGCRRPFKGYQVYRIIPRTTNHIETLRQLQANSTTLDFWTYPGKIGKPVDIMVPRHLIKYLRSMIDSQQMDSKVWIKNVQKLIDRERPARSSKRFSWDNYYPLENIYDWLDDLARRHPRTATVIVGGSTYEGREIRGMKLSFGGNKKAAFLEGGIHAREWISPATVTFILNELLTSKKRNVREVAESREWYIFPVINPDGYVISHLVKRERLWRKNTRRFTFCWGVDLNRNWDYHWMDGGAEISECSTVNAGPSPFSENETRTLSAYIDRIVYKLDAYITFHSYGKYILLPFGHQGLEKSKNYDELLRIAQEAAKSLAVRYGTRYTVGNSVKVLNQLTSGTSADWVKGKYNVRITYDYELRGTHKYGFLLPKEQIIPTGEETLDSLITIFQEADRSQH